MCISCHILSNLWPTEQLNWNIEFEESIKVSTMYVSSFWPLFTSFLLKHQFEYTASQCMAMYYHVLVEFDHPLWITSDCRMLVTEPMYCYYDSTSTYCLSVLRRSLMSSNTKVKLHQWGTIQLWASMHWCLYYVTHLQICQFCDFSVKAHSSACDRGVSGSRVFFGEASHRLAAGVHRIFSLLKRREMEQKH